MATGRECPGYTGKERFHSITVSPDGRTLASTTDAGKTITLWETATREPRAEWTGYKETIFAVALAPDGRTLATGSREGTVRLWDLPSGREIGRLEGHRGWVLALAFAPAGGEINVSSERSLDHDWITPIPGLTEFTLISS